MTSIKTYPYDPAEKSASTTQQHHEQGDAVLATVVNENSSAPSYYTAAAAAAPAANPVTVVSHSGNENAFVQSPSYVWIGTRKPVILSHCPNCSKAHVATTTRTKITGATWLGVVAGLAIFWPLCWIPLVAKPMKQTNHYCESCNAKVGRVKAFH